MKLLNKLKFSNITYVLYQTFNMDLVFWIVISNLFLTTAKGFSAFQIVLITMLGIAFSLVLSPLTDWIAKKLNNKLLIVLGSVGFLVTAILFTFCSSLYVFIIAETIYYVAASFRQMSYVMLENNLKQKGQIDKFARWVNFGRLGYSTITLIISSVAGLLFNVSAYLPMYLSITFCVIGLAFSLLYTEPKQEKQIVQQSASKFKLKTLFKNKIFILILLMNILFVGVYVFMQVNASLLIQLVCQEAEIDLAKISLIVSGIVLGSRICRVVSNTLFTEIDRRVKNKQHILRTISICLVVSGIFFAVGANLFSNLIVKLVLISIGFFMILAIRDVYSVLENKIIATNLTDEEQKHALIFSNMCNHLGRLLSSVIALVVLKFTTLNIVYIGFAFVVIIQIFIAFPLSKYLKPQNEKQIENSNQNSDINQV